MIINFKEIPQANTGSGLQDTFELFSRDFLQYLGYRIVQDPDRGADGKKDLIVDEICKGVESEYTVRWLVSCKHFAHSGKSVSDTDEPNIIERLKQHNCDGFMGIYSTIAATSLSGLLNGIGHHIIFDHEKIESRLLRDSSGYIIAKRYFPESFNNWQLENPSPAKIFDEIPKLVCEHCGKDLLFSDDHGIFIEFENADTGVIERVVTSCHGACDNALVSKMRNIGDYYDRWNDLNDICNPTIWIKTLMAFVNSLKTEKYSNEAFEKYKSIFINTYPFVARNLTTEENRRVRTLLQFDLI